MKQQLITITFFLLILCAACGKNNPLPNPGPDNNPVTNQGITITDQNGNSLIFPPGSLPEGSTPPSMNPFIPTAVMSNFPYSFAGIFMELGPNGVEFDPGYEPEIKFKIDPVSSTGKNLKIFYFDYDLNEYMYVGGVVSNNTVSVFAQHFTPYVVMDISGPTNGAPVIGVSLIPSTVRANCPLFIRASINDPNAGDVITYAKIFYKVTGGTYSSSDLIYNTSSDRYEILIDESFITTAGFQYYIEARDNHGSVKFFPTTAPATPRNVNITRTMSTIASVNPTSISINSGNQKTITVRGKDANGGSFTMIPHFSLSANLGNLTISGIFQAMIPGTGVITATAGGNVVTIPVTVNSTPGSSISGAVSVSPAVIVGTNQNFLITVTDDDYNFSGTSKNLLSVLVYSSNGDPDGEIIDLIETGNNTGIFTNTIGVERIYFSTNKITPDPDNNKIGIFAEGIYSNDVIVVRFIDDQNASGKTVTNFASLKYEEPANTITGIVKDNAGNGISGAIVQILGTGFSAISRSDGSYGFYNILPGIYTILASKDNYTLGYGYVNVP